MNESPRIIKLPFGNIRIYDSNSANEEIYKTFKWLFQAQSVDVKINRMPDAIIRINFFYNKVDGIDGPFDYNEEIQMKLNDYFKLQYGKSLELKKIENDGVVLLFEKNYNKERFNVHLDD